MDAVTAVEPIIEEVPVIAEATIKALYTTGNIIVIESKDLKNFAIRTGIVAIYGGIAYWNYKKHWKPWAEDRKQAKERKRIKESRERAEERLQAEKAKAEGFEVFQVMLTQVGTDRKVPVKVKVPTGTTYKQALSLARQGKAEIVD